MLIQKIKSFEVVCPHCGTKLLLSAEEYFKYRNEMSGYSEGTITCTEEDEKGKGCEINYTNLNCPVCDDYIPLAVDDEIDSDVFGFKCSKHCKAVYGGYEDLPMDKYLKDKFGFGEESEVD